MPAKSQSQQRFFGMVDAYKKGELPKKYASKKIKKAAEDMTSKEVKKFAKTKHDGLPERVEEEVAESMNGRRVVRVTESQLKSIVEQSVRNILYEGSDFLSKDNVDDAAGDEE